MKSIQEQLDDFAGQLESLSKDAQEAYMRFDPEMIDFRKDYDGVLVLATKDGELRKRIPASAFIQAFAILSWVFKDKTVYTWDIKRLFTYMAYRMPRRHLVPFYASIIDIKYAEAFLGIEGNAPQSFAEASERAKAVRASDQCMQMHQAVHLPLATRVLPAIETCGLADTTQRGKCHAVYQIEGQSHGRLGSASEAGSITIFNQDKDRKQCLRPYSSDSQFMVLDFKAMEICMLQWLSGDERLGKIISSGRDIYTTIYSLLYGSSCTSENRQFIKDLFIRVIYGMQPNSISMKMEVSKEEAAGLVAKIARFFGTAMSWVKAAQDKAASGQPVIDFFGRPRTHERPWAARNAVVQGPAAAVCQEKLISLWDAISWQCEIAACIHDAYILEVPIRIMQDVAVNATSILEEPSSLCPGLFLKVGVKAGPDLANLSDYRF